MLNWIMLMIVKILNWLDSQNILKVAVATSFAATLNVSCEIKEDARPFLYCVTRRKELPLTDVKVLGEAAWDRKSGIYFLDRWYCLLRS